MMVCIPTHSNIRTVEKFVKEYDIRIAIHNHGPEQKGFPFAAVGSGSGARHGPARRPVYRRRHTARCGVDVVESIALAGRRLFDMHVKDLADFTKASSQCDVGEGLMPFPAIFKQLKKMNYQGCVNLEYEINPKDPLPGVLRSMFYMRGVLAGLAPRNTPMPTSRRSQSRNEAPRHQRVRHYLHGRGRPARALHAAHDRPHGADLPRRRVAVPRGRLRHVGTHVDVYHLAAAPIGAVVTFTAEVVAVDGRRIQFRVEARDEQEKMARAHTSGPSSRREICHARGGKEMRHCRMRTYLTVFALLLLAAVGAAGQAKLPGQGAGRLHRRVES